MITKENLFYLLSLAHGSNEIYYDMYKYALELSIAHESKSNYISIDNEKMQSFLNDSDENNQKRLLNIDKNDLKKYEILFLNYAKLKMYVEEDYFVLLLTEYIKKAQAKKEIVKKIIKYDINQHYDYYYFDDKDELLGLLFKEKKKEKIIKAYLNKNLKYWKNKLLNSTAYFTWVFEEIDGILNKLYDDSNKIYILERDILMQSVNFLESNHLEQTKKEIIYDSIIKEKKSGNPIAIKIFPYFLNSKDFKRYYINKILE